ncbi:2-amino-4-hydroxy-6-hydroxymethyldihydropteridine diphosphokinase [Psychromonas sp. SR45-3]|uniref:2-amino-4-hydroxy-6- hydroxymethyldihydropteridine diphosphokinase n=1 Tax=Psychromonas sp. SR45-3 TaxID=2760930 RepID=UPI0015FC1DC8|nr:2-amino-4-hydroxy-6-hydroxymethyldihydropteridine diphosphokinase [Psychromonas sp. SR45-3]MBB1272581.1 2-amino-4-hydroxy-6-hydroxymethyldihydropteridine diphosphokinase [Psychromonas sp. SR45-3]
MISYIGIGSNQAQPIEQAKQAMTALSNIKDTQLLMCSSLYRSAPMGPQDQPDYINAVAKLETTLSALELLDALQVIEQEQGRERKALRWGPRTLDLDILLYADQVIENERLTVPHYGMKEREFVLYPLFEIAPTLKMPNGTSLIEILKHCDKNGLTAITG